MRIQDIIAAKRDAVELAAEDISRIVLDYAFDRIPDYQMSAFLMAACIRGLSFDETCALTRAMVASGKTLDLSGISGVKVDKHSTGGVGDKTTLVVVPMLAARGLKVAKMSGRGLGFTGGTLDKLESIPGFSTALGANEFVSQVNTIGAAMAGQTPDIVPADKKIYALRDVTATVESIPLISASVMSKKIACGSDVILLDVKVGSGAFMRDIESARELARTMIAIGKDFGRKVSAAITDMSQPLGWAIGNAVEVEEAIETLKGGGPTDLRLLCVKLCGILLEMAGSCEPGNGEALAESALDSGAALAKFAEIVEAQGGDPGVIEDPSVLPRAAVQHEVRAKDAGFVRSIDCARIGVAASVLGAGRELKEDAIDSAVGIRVSRKLGDLVRASDVLAVISANKPEVVPGVESMILSSYCLGEPAEVPPLVREVIG